VVRPPRGLQAASDDPVAQVASPSSDFRSASEFDPRSPRFHINTVANALPRFLAPSALPSQRKQPLPDLPVPGHVAPSHLPCALTPCSFVGLPGVFQPGSLLGFHPSALVSPEIVLASRHDFPSCDWLLPPRFARIRKYMPRSTARRPRGTRKASLQGVAPSDAWTPRRWISPLATARPALLGFFLSEALSPRAWNLVWTGSSFLVLRR